jgi:type IV pilus assembly protein PilX
MKNLAAQRFSPSAASSRAQRGASLLFALITLVALMLAASALVRSVDTGAVVLGNLGAKKATAAAADRATQMAINYLASTLTEATRLNNQPNQGYYATSKEDYDVTGYDRPTDTTRNLVNWDVDGSCDYAKAGGSLVGNCDLATRPSDALDAAALSPTDGGASARGLEARYLITRLCGTAGIDAKSQSGNNCAIALKASVMKDSNTGAPTGSSGGGFERPNQQPLYRIVVRVKGPRNAVTYTETIVNLAS